MLDNFGGNMGLYGRVEDVISGPRLARATAPNMVGTGLTPEGIFTNYVMYDLMTEMGWSAAKDVSIDNMNYWFVRFAIRRFGLENYGSGLPITDGILTLAHTVYNCTVANFHDHNILMINVPTLNSTDYTWYSLEEIESSLEAFVEASNSLLDIQTFQYDLADLTRQYLVNLAPKIYQDAILSYKLEQMESLEFSKDIFMDLLVDLDTILATQKSFLLGTWLEKARKATINDTEAALFQFNACNQVTLWGPDGQILDYAAKQWSGLLSQYYGKRWQLFFNMLTLSLEQGTLNLLTVSSKITLFR